VASTAAARTLVWLVRAALLAGLLAGLLVGTATHVADIARAGLIPRPELPLARNLFWSALVVVDPLVALVLLFRPRTGVLLVVGLMAVDLTVNITTFGMRAPVVAQMAYAALALVAVPIVRSRR
jgi:hypothetical protein